jgi:hypothetical protein
MWGPARPILADIESGTRENEVITPSPHMPNLIQLVQGTEQALPLYDPVHGSGPGEISVVQRWFHDEGLILHAQEHRFNNNSVHILLYQVNTYSYI